jgi:hypothetical protein
MAKKSRILFALLLVLVMIFTAACSAEDSDTDKDDKKSDNGSHTLSDIFGKGDKDEDTKDSESETTAPFESNEVETTAPADNTEVETTAPVENEKTENPDGIIGTVLYNNHGIKLTVTGYESESYIGPELAIQIENTSDRNVLVMSERLSVNGFMMEDALLTALVSADSVVDESIMFSRETFAQRGIKEIGKLEFHIEIFDTDTYDDIDKSDLLTLTLSEDYVVEVDYTGQELYNDNDIRIIYKGLDMDTSMNGLVYFLVENNSGKDISIWGRDVTINGIMDEDSFWIHARENTLAVGTLYLWEIGDYEIESVDQIETINLEFLVMEFDTMDDIASVPVNIEINP